MLIIIKKITMQNMNKEKIISCLEEAKEAGIFRPEPLKNFPPESYVARAIQCSVKTNKDIQEKLKEILQAEPELDIFNLSFNSGFSSWIIGTENLAMWLLNKSLENSPEEAVDKLEEYLNLSATPGYEILAITGIEIETSFKLSNELSLIPIHDLPNSMTKESMVKPSIFKTFLTAVSFGISMHFAPEFVGFYPNAAIITKTEFSPKAFDENYNGPKFKSIAHELFDACRILSLVGPCSPVPFAHWTQVEDWVPCSIFLGGSFGRQANDINSFSNKFKNEDISRVQEIYQKFSKLNQETKDRLRVPIERLNQSRRRQVPADMALDLGIALESLLLDNISHNDSISLLFRLRGAWFLGRDKIEREDLMNIFNKIYDCRSKAAHSGKIPFTIFLKTGEAINIDVFLRQGTKLCTEMILKIIDNGDFPDWKKLIIGF
ncbi:MAG: hypothetical protein HY954_03555 [Deltaproteobacteria bacterium]|nr:hypothetical protein [Deltaproteobacteria bacterium]